MKTCLICSHKPEDVAATCPMCGEGSWSEETMAAPAVTAPMSRRDRRAAEEAERRIAPTAGDVEAMADTEAEEVADGRGLPPDEKPSV